MELTTTSILALFETTKAQRQSFVDNVINEIKEGNTSPLKIHMQLKSTEDLLKTLNDNPEYKNLLLDEAAKHGKQFEMFNSKFQIKEAGTKYDYSVCQDSIYNDLQAELDAIQAKVKERQKFLQMIPENGVVSPENGEMIYRASKSSTTTLAVTLK